MYYFPGLPKESLQYYLVEQRQFLENKVPTFAFKFKMAAAAIFLRKDISLMTCIIPNVAEVVP